MFEEKNKGLPENLLNKKKIFGKKLLVYFLKLKFIF